MIKEVLMPRLGQTMETGIIEKWHKKEGETVSRGDVLLEVTTDKATLEVEAYASGVLRKIVAEEGETVPCNHLIALVGDATEPLPDVAKLKAEFARRAPVEAPPVETAKTDAAPEIPAMARTVSVGAPTPEPQRQGRVFSSPRARMLAEEFRVPLGALTGSGPGGRIVQKDVENYAAEVRALKTTATAREIAYQRGIDLRAVRPSAVGERIRKGDVARAAAGAALGAGREIPMTAMRRIIAERMTFSSRNVPHFYLFVDIDMGAATDARQGLKTNGNGKITVTDMLIKAAALALVALPRMNVRFENGKLFQNESADIGLAVAVEDGLFVPVIRNADRKSVSEIAFDRKTLVEKARSGKLVPDEYTGGSITLSNLGMYGVDYFLPIINPPESCIIGTGRITERVVARDGGMEIRPIMTVAVSADHRAVDGVIAAKFVNEFRALLESPARLLEGIQ